MAGDITNKKVNPGSRTEQFIVKPGEYISSEELLNKITQDCVYSRVYNDPGGIISNVKSPIKINTPSGQSERRILCYKTQ